MNREVKFRGKRKDTNEFIYGYFWKSSDGGYYISIDESGRGDWNNHEVYPETLGQYTSFDDNNSIEIYEGDRFMYVTKKYKSGGIVVFHDGMFCVLVMIKDLPDLYVPLIKFLKKSSVEVVGTVHSNN